MTSVTAPAPIALPADWRDFLALTKPRGMSLVVFTGLAGLLIAPAPIHPVLGFTAILCIALGAGAAAALNMWYEADLDARMKRTAKRPIPAGRMDRQSALHFGVGLAFFSVILMELATNRVAAALLAASILFYVLVYTVWLKRRTPQNIVIGGAAGAFPPVIGWGGAAGARPHPGGGGAAGRLDPLLRPRLRGRPKGAAPAKHLHRRPPRPLPAGHRLGGGDGRRHPSADPPLHPHLPVDAAAFLGALPVR